MTAEQLAKDQELVAESYNPIGGTLLPPPIPKQLAARKEREHRKWREAALEEQKTAVERAPSKPKREPDYA